MNSLVLSTDASQLKASVVVENPINIQNDVLTVEGVVSIENKNLSVINAGNNFISDKVSITNVSGEGYFFEGKDISTLRTATVFVDNIGLNEVKVSLQLSPNGVIYFDDTHYTDISIEPGKKGIVIINTFAQFIRLKYNVTDNNTTLNAYYNAQY